MILRPCPILEKSSLGMPRLLRKLIEPPLSTSTDWMRMTFPHDVKPRDEPNTYATSDVEKLRPEVRSVALDSGFLVSPIRFHRFNIIEM